MEIPKKMGKSELAAAVALLLTCGDGEERARSMAVQLTASRQPSFLTWLLIWCVCVLR